MAYAYRVINVTQCELQKFIGENRGRIGEAKERVIGEDGSQAHSARVEYGLSTEATKTGMTVNDLNLLANDNIAEYRKEGKDGRKCRLAVDDEEGNVVDLESIRKVADAGSTLVCMRDDNNFVSTVDQFLTREQRALDSCCKHIGE